MTNRKAKAVARREHTRKSKWLCVDCNSNTRYEHYFVKKEVWFDEARMGEMGMLCIGCLETRIGRRLVPEDFTSAHINNPKFYPMTERLRSRIEGKRALSRAR